MSFATEPRGYKFSFGLFREMSTIAGPRNIKNIEPITELRSNRIYVYIRDSASSNLKLCATGGIMESESTQKFTSYSIESHLVFPFVET